MADYELVLVDRTPNQLSGPTLADIDRILAPSITYTDVLNGDGRLNCSANVDRLTDDIKTALRGTADPTSAPDPLEIHVYRDGSKVWAGPVVGGQIQAGTLTLDARSHGYYLRYMWVTTDLTYTAVDQYTIVVGLVDHWQGLDYGNFGIDTSSVGTSGVTRDRTYLAEEQPNIHTAIERLSAADDGFDWWITAAGVLNLAAQRGSDLTGSVVLDRRNVADPGIAFSVAAEDVASEAFGLGTSATSDPITSTQSDTTVRQTFGRAGVTGRFDGVSVQATLDAHTRRLVDDRAGPLFVPGPHLVPIVDADVGDFGAGDTVQWSFDSGLGLQTFNRRVSQVRVSVDENGGEMLSAAFL